MATQPECRFTFRLAIKLRHDRHALGKLGSCARTHHLRPSLSRTLLGNEQTPPSLGMPGKDTESPRILTSLTSGGHIDRRRKLQVTSLRRRVTPPLSTCKHGPPSKWYPSRALDCCWGWVLLGSQPALVAVVNGLYDPIRPENSRVYPTRKRPNASY